MRNSDKFAAITLERDLHTTRLFLSSLAAAVFQMGVASNMLSRFSRSSLVGATCFRAYGSSQYNYNEPFVPKQTVQPVINTYTYNPPSLPPPQPPRGHRRNFAIATATAAIGLCYYLYAKFESDHLYSPLVEDCLRRGLFAESDAGDGDFQLALKHYLQALDECDALGMDPLEDSYTGIQLKIAEMFERLGMIRDANFIYNEIATLYLSVLTASPTLHNYQRIHSREHRRHLISRDLKVAIKLVELNNLNSALCKAILMLHLLVAQDEVNQARGSTSQILLDAATGTGKQPFTATISPDSIALSSVGESSGLPVTIDTHPEWWEPFADEFFTGMDLLSTICLTSGDLAVATTTRISMTELMMLAGVEPAQVLLSQCNLGSLLYSQAELYESKAHQLQQGFDLIPEPGNAAKAEYLAAIEVQKHCMNLAIQVYQLVITQGRTLIPSESTEGMGNECIALATYGLGVVYLHMANYDQAERLLRESRVRSRQCKYDALLPEAQRELEKLFSEKRGGGRVAKTEETVPIEIIHPESSSP